MFAPGVSLAYSRSGDTNVSVVVNPGPGSRADQIRAVAAAASMPGIRAVDAEFFENGSVRRVRVISEPSLGPRELWQDNEPVGPHWLTNEQGTADVIDHFSYLPERTGGRRRGPTGAPHPGPAQELAAAAERRFGAQQALSQPGPLDSRLPTVYYEPVEDTATLIERWRASHSV
jgi:hypothetical protein